MRRRSFLRTATFAAASVGLTHSAQAGKNQPNILFLFADDQCYETIRAFGHLDIDTPNLDRLVNKGATFTQAYNMGAWNGAVCVASRAMLNTGRFVWNAKNLKLNDEVASNRMWSQQMKQSGYNTYMTGKWHVGAKAESIFDVTADVRGGMPRQTPDGYNRPVDEADYNRKDAWKPWDTRHGGYWQGGKHWSEVVGDHGIEFLETAAKKKAPFFMYLAFNAPHDPRQAPKEYVDRYPLDRIQMPENFLPEYPHADAICGKKLRDERLAPYPRTAYTVKVQRQEYFAIITHMDAQIGRILDALEKSGKADNTYIFFTADHGLAVGHHGLIGKQNMYDHSMRVPLLVAGPGIKPGRKIAAPVYLQDIMPTAIELSGAPVPERVEFNSLLPLLNGKKKQQYKALYGAYMKTQRMVIVGDYKLIMYPTIKVNRLYNLKKDPQEMNDLAGNPEYAGKITQLKKTFIELQKQTGDTLDVDNPAPPKKKKA
ncbi:MAG: sulfatase-like hydrolase/transferase [Verrucomicrobia bacterium]|nr:sulfatase-like hydrolase/transferase [Verrucomicrobiota bacterium]